MREIKFRARFICGMCNKTYWYEFRCGQVMLLNHQDCGKAHSCEKGGYCDQHQTGEIVQFTGMKDKNSKEIYEGDIVLFLSGKPNNTRAKPAVVRCRADNWGGFWLYTKDKTYKNDQGEPLWESVKSIWSGRNGSGLEIIGNIYENPELLK